MSKILDRIKKFGHSLADMFKENDELEEDYMNPDSKEGQELAERMKPYVERINQMEEEIKHRADYKKGSYTQTLHVDSLPIKDTSKVVEGKGHSAMGKDAERDVQE